MTKLANFFKLSICHACILAVFLVWPMTPLHASVSEQQIPLNERIEAQQLYDQALEMRNAGDASSAQTTLEQVIILNPKLAEAHSLLAVILAAKGEYETANLHIKRAIGLSANDPDIKMAKARILSWQGKTTEAKEIVTIVVAEFPEYSDAQDFLTRLETIETSQENLNIPWQVGVSFSRSTFSKVPLTPWKQTTFSLYNQINEHNSAVFTLDMAERFSLHDVSVSLGINHNFENKSGLHFSLLSTIGAEFLPKWAMKTGGFLKLNEGNGFFGPTIVGVDGKYSSYGLVKVKGVDLWLSQYILAGKVWVTIRSINSFVNDGANPKGYSIRFDGYLKEGMRFFAGYADAPESDRGIVTTTKSYFTGFNFAIKDNLDFNVSYAHHDRENSYVRKEITVGLVHKF